MFCENEIIYILILYIIKQKIYSIDVLQTSRDYVKNKWLMSSYDFTLSRPNPSLIFHFDRMPKDGVMMTGGSM